MATQPMKTLTIDGTTYEIVDDASRQRTGELSGLNTDTKTNIVAAINEHETQINNKADSSSVPTKTSDLTNDSNFISDSSYVHTDNNYTTTEKTKLSGMDTGATRNIIDSSMSDSSTNAVQNNVVKSYIDNADTSLSNQISALQGAVGSPLVAATVSAMTDTTKIYVYIGSESGYTNGNWYYYNGSSWVSGGVYNSVAVATDKTLSVEDMPADAKKVGEITESTKNKIVLLNATQTSNGVTITSDSKSGLVKATGTSTGAGFVNITDVLTLPAGTYTINPNATNHLYFQVRSTNNTYIAQTGPGTSATFTLESETSFRIRATWTATFNETAEDYPQLEEGESATWFIPSLTAKDYVSRHLADLLEAESVKFNGILESGADYDDCTDVGYWTCGYGSSYSNDPVGANHRRLIFNFSAFDAGASYLIQILLQFDTNDVAYYTRFRSSGTWGAWSRSLSSEDLMQAMKNNVIYEYANEGNTSTVQNVGSKLNILSYNVAHYNKDTETYINDGQIFSIKNLLCKAKPDFIGLQEAREYIDSVNTKLASNYLYKPVFPYSILASGGSVLSKYTNIVTYDNMAYSNGRNLLYVVFTIGEKKLLFITTHPVADYESTGTSSAESISARLTQYTELMQWVNSEIQLTSQDGQRTKYCPEWDYCIICGDFNSITATDRTNLKTVVNNKGFSMANGGWLGWLETARNNAGTVLYSLDNIICSSNIIINSVEVYKSLYDDLYSDHYPLSAEITLLNS